MSQSARVTSLGSLYDLKAALCVFTAAAKEALSSVEMEIRRTLDWLNEQLKYWQATVRHCEDAVFQAKNDLARRRLLKISDRPPDCSEQEEALQKARERLAFAEEQVDRTRRWQRQLPEAIIEYEGPARQLAGVLETELPKADALLENKIMALEAYIQLAGAGAAPASVASPAPTLDNEEQAATAVDKPDGPPGQ